MTAETMSREQFEIAAGEQVISPLRALYAAYGENTAIEYDIVDTKGQPTLRIKNVPEKIQPAFEEALEYSGIDAPMDKGPLAPYTYEFPVCYDERADSAEMQKTPSLLTPAGLEDLGYWLRREAQHGAFIEQVECLTECDFKETPIERREAAIRETYEKIISRMRDRNFLPPAEQNTARLLIRASSNPGLRYGGGGR